MKAFKFRLKTKKRPDLAATLEQTLELCRELHNAAVQERRDAYRINGLSLDLYSQKKQLLAHCEANKLIDCFDEIHVEKLELDRMIEQSDFAKSIHDAGWRNFVSILSNKAEEAGRKVIYKAAA